MSSTGRRGRAVATYHLKLRPGDLPPDILVPGDPDRATEIAESWDRHRLVREHREFRSYRGRYLGVSIGAVSCGIGGPAMAIAVEELARLGAQTLLRVGSCGAISPEVLPGDIAITLAAIRFDGASRSYAPLGYPAVSDPDLFQALVAAARSSRHRFHTGITASVDTFFLEQGRPGFGGFFPASLGKPREELRRLRVMNIEMECATLFTLGRLYGLRAGAICTVFGDAPGGDPLAEDTRGSIRIANEAVRRLRTLLSAAR